MHSIQDGTGFEKTFGFLRNLLQIEALGLTKYIAADLFHQPIVGVLEEDDALRDTGLNEIANGCNHPEPLVDLVHNCPRSLVQLLDALLGNPGNISHVH